MTAGHGGAQGTGGAGGADDLPGAGRARDTGHASGAGSRRECGGPDALMAAITGEPLSEEARADPAFRAEHRAAEADVAVLRAQLTWLAEALTGERADVDAEPAKDAETESGRGQRPVPRPRGVTRPVSAGRRRPPRPPRPGRPSGPRRALRIAFGSLAGAAAFALVVGFGWLVAHSDGSDDDAGSAAGKSAADAPATVSGDGGRPSDPPRVLACSRLVVEGTVAKVEPQKQSPWRRITLTVIRSYKPTYQPPHGPAQVSFLLDGGAEPAPRTGQHVLVRVGVGQMGASLWAVGDTRVAVNRAWITKALPTSRRTTCTTDEAPTDEP
ncbi:hypothetical protein AB0L59_02035 [Streptomyces sp. NPDC052109]|uniref:hypothetical protein n=1 Tax=Streptomyces sp. NPDC052109 TaxID=3155527 RepID=UPI00344809F7